MIRFRKAIFIIHGFTGNLYDNEYLMNYLEYDREFDVYAKTLPGHDRDRFCDAKYTDWVRFVDKEIDYLVSLGYKNIYVVGHSMGGVLASYVASRHKEIKKLVLINAAFDYINLKQNKLDIITNKDFSKYNHLLEKLLRTSIGFFIEFTKLVKKHKHVLSDVTCETLVLQSDGDEIIPFETGNEIYEKLNTDKKYLTTIRDCSHVALVTERKEDISEYIRVFLKGGRKWKKNMKDVL